MGPRRDSELAAGLPRIPSNILAARLRELQAVGVIRHASGAVEVRYGRRALLARFARTFRVAT